MEVYEGIWRYMGGGGCGGAVVRWCAGGGGALAAAGELMLSELYHQGGMRIYIYIYPLSL